VNWLDLVLLGAMLMAAIGGYRLGFLARAASWIGLGIGLVVASRLLPTALRAFGGTDPTGKFFLAGGLLVAGAFIGQALGLLVGQSIRKAIPFGPARVFDRVVGGVAGVLGIVVVAWFMVPAMADVPGGFARQARTSVIARALDALAPRPPDTLEALRHLVGDTTFPKVFDSLKPAPETGPPPATIGLSAAVVDRVAASTVKVQGTACRRIQEGSGFVVGADLVATNAHVVAGEKATQVQRPDGRTLNATVVVFDSDRDLAILRVPGIGEPALPVGTAKVGAHGAVFGHPGGQAQLRVAPAAISQRVDARGRDLYDAHSTSRDVYILAADLHPGDSGAALVDLNGDVVGVAFAIAPDKPGTSYALTSKELNAALAEPRAPAASTGPCLTHG
jgi:S1-C subfamily serine protease